MKISLVDGGFLYDKPVGDNPKPVSGGLYYCCNKIEDALSDIDCEGVDYSSISGGRTLSYAQQETADFIMENKRCFVFNGMGTGKTMSSLMCILPLSTMNPKWRFLIISSKTVLSSAWIPEVEEVCPHFPLTLCDGSQEKKRNILNDRKIRFVGCSADSLHLVPRGSFQVIIVDEATLFKSAQGIGGSVRGKNMCELANDENTERLILMTGTPRAHNCMDAYGLYFVMNDKQRRENFRLSKQGIKVNKILNKSEFRNELCVPVQFRDFMILKSLKNESAWDGLKYTINGGIFKELSLNEMKERLNHASRDATCMWIERQNANEILMNLLSPAIAFRTEDVLDLPDCPIIDHFLNTSEEDKETINKIKKEMILDFKDKKDIISNKMILEGKMEQINCGIAYDSEGNGRILLKSNYNQVMKFIIERLSKLPLDKGLVIASRYNHILNAVYSVIEIILGKGSVNIINGSVSSKARTQYVKDFRSLKTRVLLANTACLSHGVTLVEAKEMILLDTPQYAEPYIQVKGRVHRRGQKWEIPIYRIIGNATVKRRFDILEGAEERDEDFVKLITNKE